MWVNVGMTEINFTRYQPTASDGWRCTVSYFVRINGRSVGWVLKSINSSTSGSWSAKRGGITIGHGYATRREAAQALRTAAGL